MPDRAAMPVPPALRPPSGPQAAMLADGRRLHLNEGPIDLVIEACGSAAAVARAYEAAMRRFDGLLADLCGELPLLRRPVLPGDGCPLQGRVARRMWNAVAAVEPHAGFITPMAAVAGAVAEEVLAAMRDAAERQDGLTRAYVNNGGDIALFLAPEQTFTIGLVDRPDRPRVIGTATLDGASPARGVATSGWRGRSFSRGIADAVTVLAASAAAADAAATVIANRVDLPGHPGIRRTAARELQPDNDLGDIPVTVAVPDLPPADRDGALRRGLLCAKALVAQGLIVAATLHLQGRSVATGPGDAPQPGFHPGRLPPSLSPVNPLPGGCAYA
ncbi:UPF0280 family protein [Pseudochelatococcus sp. B33]